jgi:exodeoxyribonuclease VII large subunit
MGADPRPYSVPELVERIRTALESRPDLSRFSLQGELQSLKRHSSGHVYFTMVGTDPAGASVRIDAVLFRSDATRIPSWPKDGDEVIVQGRVGYYPPQGRVQVYASRIRPVGQGAQARAKRELQELLEREGLFDPRLKRPFPSFPARVALVTSPTGAALQDVLKVSRVRFPQAEILLVPVQVQGAGAPGEIVRGLRAAGRTGADCVLLVRGGGNREDLNPFDEERVVRALRLCPIPVAAGLGHQVDLTLADLAADFSAPTPSAAAERIFPDRRELVRRVSLLGRTLAATLGERFQREFRRLDRCASEARRALTDRSLRPRVLSLEERGGHLERALRRSLGGERSRIEALGVSLRALSPLAVLDRGYAICVDGSGRAVRRAESLRGGDVLKVQFLDGDALGRVEEVHPRKGAFR